MMKGYDDNGNILLPPRLPGEDLPPELLAFYQDHKIAMSEGEVRQADGEMDGSIQSVFASV